MWNWWGYKNACHLKNIWHIKSKHMKQILLIEIFKYLYMLVLKKYPIIIPKYKVIKLNIYIFNAFVVKILITNLTFRDKVHKSKNIYYNIESQWINARNKHYII